MENGITHVKTPLNDPTIVVFEPCFPLSVSATHLELMDVSVSLYFPAG